MPELPEVEVTRRSLAARLVGCRATAAVARARALRYPLPGGLGRRLAGRTLRGIERRGKYLLFDFGEGRLILRLRDPRRFGAVLWLEGSPEEHPLLARLGLEPLSRAFTADRLADALHGRGAAIKPALMDAGIVVGVGNIYASESLHRAGIDPRTPAGRLSKARLERLVPAIKATLRAAIRAGGSSLRDHVRTDGTPGGFQSRHRVYGRAGEPCRACGAPVRVLRQGNRATFYCPRCQR